MALCVTLQADGTLVPTGQPVAECTGYVLVSGSEHGVYAAVQQALAMPTAEEANYAFTQCFFLVLGMYMVAHVAGVVASVFNSHR